MPKTNGTNKANRVEEPKAVVRLTMYSDHVEQRIEGHSADIEFMIAYVIDVLAKSHKMSLKDFYKTLYDIWMRSTTQDSKDVEEEEVDNIVKDLVDKLFNAIMSKKDKKGE